MARDQAATTARLVCAYGKHPRGRVTAAYSADSTGNVIGNEDNPGLVPGGTVAGVVALMSDGSVCGTVMSGGTESGSEGGIVGTDRRLLVTADTTSEITRETTSEISVTRLTRLLGS